MRYIYSIQSDQIVSGTAINVLAFGITGFVRRLFLLTNPFGAPGIFPYVIAKKIVF
jgi:ABC-type uncharacterized transport system permease subunit